MNFAFLPHEGKPWLFNVSDGTATPLVRAPGEHDARWRVSEDSKEFGFIDQECKRIGHYRFLDGSPWFEKVSSPLTLPKSSYANDLIIYMGIMIVAGHSKCGESLWIRDPENHRKWMPIQLPKGLAKPGKSIDALYVRHANLIAIDNIVTPKWILVYDLEPTINATTVSVLPLRAHMTHESINCTAEGADFYALQSVGVNHGNTCLFISLLDKESLAERACWTFVKDRNQFSRVQDSRSLLGNEISLNDISLEIETSGDVILQTEIEKIPKIIDQSEIEIPYGKITSMKFCERCLLLSADDLFVTTVPVNTFDRLDTLPKFMKYPLTKLKRVVKLESVFGISSGIYAVGESEKDEMDYEWIEAGEITDFMESA